MQHFQSFFCVFRFVSFGRRFLYDFNGFGVSNQNNNWRTESKWTRTCNTNRNVRTFAQFKLYSLRCFCYFCYCRPFFSDTFCFLFHLFICRIRYLCRALDEMTKKCLLKWKDISKQRKIQQKRYLPLIWSRLKETTTTKKNSTKHKTLFSKEFYFLLLMPLLVLLNDSFFSAFVHLYLIRCRGSNVSEWMCEAISFSPKFQCNDPFTTTKCDALCKSLTRMTFSLALQF